MVSGKLFSANCSAGLPSHILLASMNKLLLFFSVLLLFVACESGQVPQEVIPPLNTGSVPDHAFESLAALQSAEIPQRDLAILAERFLGVDVSQTLPAKQNKVGDVEQFWYLRDGQTNTRVSAELIYQSSIINIWLEEGTRYDKDDFTKSVLVLENKIIPTNRAFFGDEPRPGIDGDERVNFLHLDSLGGASANSVIAGYFSAADLYPATANQFSNEREMLYINLSAAPFGSVDYYQVIAHEFEHLIQSATDRNEVSWTDEGLAELSAYINGYTEVDSVNQYVDLPDVQLNDWSQGGHEDLAHYGASFLWNAYFLGRFGEDATKAVVAHEENGFAGYQKAMQDIGSNITTDELFGDWVVANYLTGIERAKSPYEYEEVAIPEIAIFAEHDSFPVENRGAVYQYGVDYVKISATEPITFSFEGSNTVQLLPTEPHSGDFFFTTFPADRSDMSLSRSFDLTAVNDDEITLNFWTWYEIEEGWDYGYVAISADSGETWEMLGNKVDFTTANPQGNNYGVALTGSSGFEEQAVWRESFVDLTAYAGEEIILRFEYITDDAVFEAGWAIDDITIDAIDYAEDFESGMGGWEASGWIRHTNILPQSYWLQAIYMSEDDVLIEQLGLSLDQSGIYQMPLNDQYNQVVITISGNAPVTKQRAAYTYTID